MATTYNGISIEMKHFNQIRRYVPRISEMDQRTLDILIEMGALQVSTLLELAIANVGDLDVISADAHDLSDGSEVKMATVRNHRRGTSYGAMISNTKNKTGLVRAQVMEPIGSTPAEFRARIEAEIVRWAPVIRAANIKVN